MTEMSRYIDAMQFLIEKKLQYCQDCENRKGIKNGKKVFCYEIGDAPCKSCGINDMLDAIEDYPTADVEPVVHAKWEHTKMFWKFYCSNCKANGIYFSPYCPNCGAKMDEVEKE